MRAARRPRERWWASWLEGRGWDLGATAGRRTGLFRHCKTNAVACGVTGLRIEGQCDPSRRLSAICPCMQAQLPCTTRLSAGSRHISIRTCASQAHPCRLLWPAQVQPAADGQEGLPPQNRCTPRCAVSWLHATGTGSREYCAMQTGLQADEHSAHTHGGMQATSAFPIVLAAAATAFISAAARAAARAAAFAAAAATAAAAAAACPSAARCASCLAAPAAASRRTAAGCLYSVVPVGSKWWGPEGGELTAHYSEAASLPCTSGS